MAEIFVISDTHFGHENIIKYCSRPFANADEMDEVIISNWNKVVPPSAHVYHLGDVAVQGGGRLASDSLHRCLPRLNGHLRLVLGNHDDQVKMESLLMYFDKILMWRLFKPFILTHVPIHRESFGKAQYNIHGHIHEKASYGAEYMNVCVERTNYTPVSLDDVMKYSRWP